MGITERQAAKADEIHDSALYGDDDSCRENKMRQKQDQTRHTHTHRAKTHTHTHTSSKKHETKKATKTHANTHARTPRKTKGFSGWFPQRARDRSCGVVFVCRCEGPAPEFSRDS